MQLEDYKSALQKRYMELTEDEKEVVRDFNKMEVSQIFSYLLGPELNPLLTMLRSPAPKQVATQPPAQEAVPMAKGGLVSRPKKAVAKKK